MSKLLELYDVADLRKYLEDTVVLLNGRPVQVRQVLVDGLVRIKRLSTGRMETVEAKKLETGNIPTGFVNNTGYCYLVEKTSNRSWKLGLSRGNTVQYLLSDNKMLPGAYEEAVLSKGFNAAVLGEFPSLEKCLEVMNSDAPMYSMAFDRMFAVTKRDMLFYKTLNVGVINPENGKAVLSREYLHLRKLLND